METLPKEASTMEITSNEFDNKGEIPSLYTCDGEDINPPLNISGIPEGTKSLALIMDDPDAPVGTWTHWIVWNISPTTNLIKEDSIPGIQGKNGWNKNKYGGPCPPSGTHRYFFKLYALDTELELKDKADSEDLQAAIQEHIIGEAELIGRYRRS